MGATAAFAVYNADSGGGGGKQNKHANSANGDSTNKAWTCGAEGCKNNIKDSVKQQMIARKKEFKEKGRKFN
eukprot:SAG31_NODE_24511_length_480_cov_0.595801_1_plen_71_part_10